MMCADISDEMVELFAMDKHLCLDDELIRHLKTCLACRERVEEAQEWAAQVRKLRGGNP